MVRQFTDEEVTALDEMVEMLDAGTADGQRLVAWVNEGRSVVVDVAVPDSYGRQNLIYGSDGKLRTSNGNLLTPGRLIYGQSIDMEGLMLFNSVGLRSTRGESVYIKESIYDAKEDAINLMSEGAQSPFDALKARKG
jgi:hypothetical protein